MLWQKLKLNLKKKKTTSNSGEELYKRPCSDAGSFFAIFLTGAFRLYMYVESVIFRKTVPDAAICYAVQECDATMLPIASKAWLHTIFAIT